MKTVGIVLNTSKPEAKKTALYLIKLLEAKKIRIKILEDEARNIGKPRYGCKQIDLAGDLDFAFILGGDGTVLRSASIFYGVDVPIFGINMGKKGFLTQIEVHELDKTFPRIIKGQFQLEERMMLEASVYGGKERVKKLYALNEFILMKESTLRLIEIKVRINQKFFAHYVTDGLIIATPTGSTAYSLSAGGAIVDPAIEGILLTPICPHTLFSRTVVISVDKKIGVSVNSKKSKAYLNIDGRESLAIRPDDRIIIKKADYNLKLARMKSYNFYELLRKKLKLGES